MKMNGLLRKILVMGIVALFLGVIGLAFFKVNIVAYASGAIYIRADGSVEGTAFIQSSDNVTYVFTADVNDCDYMYVQRSNIIVDGNGHLLNSSGAPEDGVSVMFVNNVTIKNVSVQGFGFGIYLYDAANNTISGNNLTNNYAGIGINSCGNNTVSGNTVTGNIAYGIYLYSSSNYNSIFGNNIIGNNITNNEDGVYLESSSGNTVSGNNITNCSYGIYLVMQNIANDVTDLSVTIGDIVLNNNTISSNSNGIFVDVHDVVLAYHLLLKKGKRGEVYNVCSGQGRAIQDIVTILSEMLGIHVRVQQELTQIRPIDNPRIIGSNQKIRHDLGWTPAISFEQSLRSMYEYWDMRLPHKSKT